jgi:CHAD domain-containing protein
MPVLRLFPAFVFFKRILLMAASSLIAARTLLLRASVREMAFAETDRHLRQVLDNLPKATSRHLKKNKFIHDLRVETRRSTAALELYADFLPAKHRVRLEKRLKKIRRAAGKARDLDVFIGLLEQDKTGQNPGPLLEIAKDRRKKAQDGMVRAGKRARQQGLHKDIRRFLKEAGKRRKGGGMRFGPWARAELRPRMRAFFEAAPPANSGLKRLHEFRIQAKYLRYTMEMLETAFPPSFSKELLPRVQRLQDRIGELIDIRTRKKKIEKWLPRAPNAEAAHHFREYISLETSRLAQAQADFVAWCTPAFLGQLRADFENQLAELVLVHPPLGEAS